MLTYEKYITASNKYPDRLNSRELSNEFKANANKLVKVINAFLIEAGVDGAEVSSGFRPSAVNKALSNAAKASLHMSCLAVDLADPNGEIYKKCDNRELLKKHGLFIEDQGSTKGWCHLDMSPTRPDRPSRKFIP